MSSPRRLSQVIQRAQTPAERSAPCAFHRLGRLRKQGRAAAPLPSAAAQELAVQTPQLRAPPRWAAWGLKTRRSCCQQARLVVSFTERGDVIRIISARKADREEREDYENAKR